MSLRRRRLSAFEFAKLSSAFETEIIIISIIITIITVAKQRSDRQPDRRRILMRRDRDGYIDVLASGNGTTVCICV